MKYYYGNSYKEALSNDPVEIKSTDVLEQYRECYSCVIEAGNDLPHEITVPIDELDWEPGDEAGLPAALGEWLTDNYDCNAYSFNAQMPEPGDEEITVTEIDWECE